MHYITNFNFAQLQTIDLLPLPQFHANLPNIVTLKFQISFSIALASQLWCKKLHLDCTQQNASKYKKTSQVHTKEVRFNAMWIILFSMSRSKNQLFPSK